MFLQEVSRMRALVIAGAVLVVGVLLSGYAEAQNRDQTRLFQPRPLIGASDQEIGQYAIEMTRAVYRIVSGTPDVRLVRRVTTADLDSLGFGRAQVACGEPPLMLVVLRGDIDVGGAFRGLSRIDYLAYVFDLRSGTAPRIRYSVDGRGLGRALNDPTLPDGPPAVTASPGPILQSTPSPVASQSSSAASALCDGVVPGLVPPSAR
jgi:hypothetical protein